jgi:glycosyltransferase involved in cell wall biosynthesis
MRPWTDPDQMNRYLDTVDVGMVPLIQDTKFNNCKSPTKLFEYMAKGLPVVASPTQETRRVITHGTNCFLAASGQEFTDILKKICADAELRQKTGARARADVEAEYSLTVCGRKLYEVVKRVAG